MDGQITWTPGISLDAVEKQVIQAALRHFCGNKAATAVSLGIAARTLDNKLAQYEAEAKTDIERKSSERRNEQDWLARARGERTPDNSDTAATIRARTPSVPRPGAGVQMESVANAPAQPAMPMPKREEVQSMPPKQAAQGHPGKRR